MFAIAAGGVLAAPASAALRSSDPALELAFEVTVTLGAPVELGAIDGARHRFVPITGGHVAGPRLTGDILLDGGDWQQIRGDGLTIIHARYFIRAADGTSIAVDNPGVRVASPEVIARLTAGEDLDPGLYYFRTAPQFTVAAGPHDWLTRSIFVAQGVRHPASVVMRVFRVT